MKCHFLTSSFFLLLCQMSPAAITVLDYYRLGDDDPGAIAGIAGNATTKDSVGSRDLTREGTPLYSSNVPFSEVGGAANAHSMSFSGASSEDYSFPTRLTDAQDNFGLEAFVNASTLTGNAGIVYNGKAGSSGFGLHRIGNTFQAQIGSNPGVFFGSATVSTGDWIHLALVRDNGISTFYVDGVAADTSSATPHFGSIPFRIGSSVGTTDDFFGLIDEVRIFTFAPNSFSTDDLLVNQVPEPNTSLLIILGMLAVACKISPTRRSSEPSPAVISAACAPEPPSGAGHSA